MGVLSELAQKRGTSPPEQTSLAAAPEGEPTVEASPLQNAVLNYGGFLPAVGGAVGGLAGAGAGTVFGLGVGGVPGGIGGAALGGAGGEAAKQLLERAVGLQAPETSGEAAGAIGLQGAEQGAFQAAGAGLGKLAGAGGKALISSKLGQQGLRAVDPAMVALREGINTTRGGFAKLVGKIMESNRAGLRAIKSPAIKHLDYHTALDIADPAHAVTMDAVAKSPVYGEDLKTASRLTQNFLRDNPGRMSPERLWEIKKKADAIARPIYNKIDKQEVVTASELARAHWHKSLADRARELLHADVPGLAQIDARSHELQVLKSSLRRAVKGHVPISSQLAARGTVGAVAGGAAAALPGSTGERAQHGIEAAALASLIASNPTMLSWIARLMASRGTQAVAGQVPRAVMAGQQ